MRVKEESGKIGLKPNIHETKIMASGPIASWHIFLFSWAPESLQTVSAAMKLRHSHLGKKAMANLDSVLKSRDIILPIKVYIDKAMIFPVVIYGRELDHKEG